MRYLISLFICAAAIAADLGDPSSLAILQSVGAACNTITAETAVFDGVNDYTTRANTLSGLADGSEWTLSFWLKCNGGDGTEMRIFNIADNTTTRFQVTRNANNFIYFVAATSAGSVIARATNSVTTTSADGWTHILIVDNRTATSASIYVNGVSKTVNFGAENTTGTIDLVPVTPVYRIGAGSTAGQLLNASLAEVYFNDVLVNDVSDFYCGGKPVDIGADGSTPTGSAPVLYFSTAGSGNSWDNSASASTFTITGSLGTDTPP